MDPQTRGYPGWGTAKGWIQLYPQPYVIVLGDASTHDCFHCMGRFLGFGQDLGAFKVSTPPHDPENQGKTKYAMGRIRTIRWSEKRWKKSFHTPLSQKQLVTMVISKKERIFSTNKPGKEVFRLQVRFDSYLRQ
jgi:hypothetical protein